MNRLDNLGEEVEKLYKASNSQADPWIDWGYDNHVLIVAKKASQLAKGKGATQEYCEVAALLHDVADTVMNRDEPGHKEKSLEMAREILSKSGFPQEEVEIIVTEIIKPHDCKEKLPETLEGKILATADAMAHFQTDFYLYFCWEHFGGEYLESFRKWVLAKIEKDFNRKIFFAEVREQIRDNYEAIKKVFSL